MSSEIDLDNPEVPIGADLDRVAIRVSRLGKAYTLYSGPVQMLRDMLSASMEHASLHWALRDVSFEIRRGAVVGIIGPNGSGKSTLLKIIAGLLDSTTGSVEVHGRLSAILELGTGFHPDLSGRDNIVTGGMCLGLSRAEIEQKIPWIIDFSEMGAVIDQPFRTYSSGMQARLTFATAICIDPEILIIDEALAAGDAYFVHKCMRRIREICNSGATVLFVSHSEGLIADLCDEAIWINNGELLMHGPAEPVTKAYIHSVWELEKQRNASDNANLLERFRETASSSRYELGGDTIRITRLELLGPDGPTTGIVNGEPLQILVEWEGETEADMVYIGYRIDSDRLQAVSGFDAYQHGRFLNGGRRLKGKGRVIYTIPRAEFGEGRYFISVSICRHMLPKGKEAYLHYLEKALTFSVRRAVPYSAALVYEPAIEMTEEQTE